MAVLFFRLQFFIIFLAYESLAFVSHSSSGKVQGRSHEIELNKTCEYFQQGLIELCADCSYRGITEIPEYLLSNITCLNLVGNNIEYLSGGVWNKYKSLKKLSLARNHISALNNGDLYNLSKLKMLDLSLNYIRYNNVEENAFEPLISLIYLDLKQNLTYIFDNETYPTSLQHLQKLKTLMIDGLDNEIPYMSNLSVLYLSGQYGRCNIPYLRKSMFKSNFLNLKSLYLSNCSIVKIEQNISSAWPNIQDLDVSWNTKLGFRNITVGIGSKISLRQLKKLNLNSVYDYYKFDMCSALTKEDIEYLNDTSIEVYAIESNNLVRLEYDSIMFLPKSLKYVSVRDNMLMYGKYVDEILQHNTFQNLLYFDTGQMFLSHEPNDFVHNNENRANDAFTANHNPKTEKDINTAMFTRFQVKDYFQTLDERLAKFNITRDGDRSGIVADAQNKIEYIDLSENMPGTISVTLKLFEHSPCVKVLNISSNYLGYQLLDDNTLFRNFSSLRVLDLSSNGIIQLLPGVFRNQVKLERLYLSYNKITNMTFLIDSLQTKNLKYLDLSSNHMQTIPAEVRSLVESLTNLTINIVNNNLRCACDTLDFVSWVKHNAIIFQKLAETSCRFENGSSVTLNDIDDEQLHFECSPPTFSTLILVVSLCIFAFIIIVSCGLIYRFKWNLRYLYYMTKFKLAGGYQQINGREFEKDVFVSYANEDRGFILQHVVPELEKEGEISLLVHDRDFLAGEFVSDNILRAITSTRRTLVILTKDYIRSKWCMYEMNMARMEAVDTDRNVLCVVLKEDIPLNHIPLEIIDVIKKKTYMEFPTDPQHVSGFWDRLRETLRHDM